MSVQPQIDQETCQGRVDVALIHYPVCNKNGEIIGSAVTNLDIHDIARAARTFGVTTYYVVTPFDDQRRLVQEIVDHWRQGYGSHYNGDRKAAMATIEIIEDLDTLYRLSSTGGNKPLVVATSAREHGATIGYGAMRRRINAGEHVLLLFGTAWGLAAEVVEQADAMLPPICGRQAYRHLSVRSAVSIVLDRLLGERDEVFDSA